MNIKIISILIGIVLLLVGILAVLQTKLEKAKLERDQVVSFSLAKDDSLQYLTTKLGQESAKSNILDLTVRNLQRMQNDKDLAWIKQIEGINKRMNNVEQITTTTARAVGNFRIRLQDTTIHHLPLDTAQAPIPSTAKAFDNKNKWFRLRGYILPDTLVAMPEVYVPIQSVVYWERKKFLGLKIGRKSWFKQTTTPNPYVKIIEAQLIQINKRKPK